MLGAIFCDLLLAQFIWVNVAILSVPINSHADRAVNAHYRFPAEAEFGLGNIEHK